MNQLILLLLTLLFSFSSKAQFEWIASQPNASLPGSVEFDVVTTDGGSFYLAFYQPNTGNNQHDFFLTKYNISLSTWSTVHNIPVTVHVDSNFKQAISMTYVNDTVYTLFLSNENTDEYQLIRSTPLGSSVISTTTFMMGNYHFELQAGQNASELYLALQDANGKPEVAYYDFGSNSWTGFSNFSSPAHRTTVYNNADSVYFGFTQNDAMGTGRVYAYGAPKSNLTLGGLSPLGSGLISYTNPNTSATDTVASTQRIYFFGSPTSNLYLLAHDNNQGAAVSIPLSTSGGGLAVFPALSYTNESDYHNLAEGGYLYIHETSTSISKVFRKDHSSNSFSQFGIDLLDITLAKNLRISGVSNLRHKLVGFIDTATALHEYKLYISNYDPQHLQSIQNVDLCGTANGTLLMEATFIDLDGDSVFLAGAVSSNNTVLNQANISYTATHSGDTTFIQVYCNHNDGSISMPTAINLSLNFSDHRATYNMAWTVTVTPAQSANFLDDVELCLNQAEVDLYDFVDVPGGHFTDIDNSIELPRFLTAADFYSLAGNYDIQYTIDTGCYEKPLGSIHLFAPPVASIDAITQPSTCTLNNGSITASYTLGTAGLNYYQWNNGINNSLTISNLGVDVYNFLVVDLNNCQDREEITLNTQNVGVNATIDSVFCHGASTGNITLGAITGMTAPYTYLWSNGVSQANNLNIPAGNYSVTITDATGCQTTMEYNVHQRAPIVITSNIVSPNCGQSDGAINIVNVSGGQPAYSYLWSTTATTPNISNIPYGIYTVTVTDAAGCQKSRSINVSEVGGPIVFGNISPTGCGAANGGVNVTAIPTLGGGNFTYLWSNTAITEDISGVAAGTYSIFVTDDNNCSAAQNFVIPVRPPAKNNICIVTVDLASSSTLVVWEKVESTGVDYYKIYRESNVPNQFLHVGNSDFDSLSVFNDLVVSPVIQSRRYRLSAVNDCGVEGPLSNSHRTIRASHVPNGTNLFKVTWNYYEGAAYSSMTLYKHTAAAPVWVVVNNSIAASSTQFNDLHVGDTAGLEYHIGFDLLSPCQATFGRAEDYNFCRSNRTKGEFNAGSGAGNYSNNSVNELTAGSVHLLYYPNPAHEVLYVQLNGVDKAEYQILGLLGSEIANGTFYEGESELNMAALPSGVYYIRLLGTEGMVFRVVKE